MSPQAVRIRTTSGWQDIALQGAQGPPGRMQSCRAQSAISFAAADTNYRGISLNFSTVNFDDFGNSFSPTDRWTCRATGRYLCIASYEALSATGAVGIFPSDFAKKHSATVTKGADGQTMGTSCAWIKNYNVGDVLSLGGWHSGGGTGVYTFEVIRIDAPSTSLIEVPVWQNWVPIIKQAAATPAFTNSRSRYCQLGKLVHFQSSMILTAAGAAGAVNISGFPLPFTGVSNPIVGQCWVSVASLSPPNIVGTVVAMDASSVQLVAGGQFSNYVGLTPAFSLASGNAIQISGTYETP